MNVVYPRITLKRVLLFLGMSILALYLIHHAIGLTFETPDLHQVQKIRAFILHFGIWGPLVLIALGTATFVFAPLSGTPLFIASVYLYNEWSAIYLLVIQLLGASISFWIARLWGRQVVKKLAGHEQLQKMDLLPNHYAVMTLFALRLSQIGIQDFLSYAAGITKMSFATYVTTSLVGWAPSIVVLFYIIPRLHTFQYFILLYALWSLVAAGLYGVWFTLLKRQAKA